jgi:hypothetical protein
MKDLDGSSLLERSVGKTPDDEFISRDDLLYMPWLLHLLYYIRASLFYIKARTKKSRKVWGYSFIFDNTNKWL